MKNKNSKNKKYQDERVSEQIRKSIKSEINYKLKEYFDIFLDKKRSVIPVSGKKYDHRELIEVVDAVLGGWWTDGIKTKEFEKKFNNFLGVKNTIVVNSGSSANLLALKTLSSPKLGERRLRPGDEIITIAASFPTTISPIVQCGCIPVFCDINIPSYNINITQLKKAVSNKTKAIFLAHTLGNPFDLGEVVKLCKKHDLLLIEDNCDSLGSRYENQLTGTFGILSTHSFYPAHHITMAEGGALCTDDFELAKIARSIREWGRDCWCGTGQDNSCKKRYEWKLGNLPSGYDHKYIYSEIGYNLKNTDLNVALAVAQMDKLEMFIKQRKINFQSLRKKLSCFQEYLILPEAAKNSDPSWFGFMITLKKDAPFSRLQLLRHLNHNGVDTRLLFAGNVTKQPFFINNCVKYKIADILLNTDFVMENSFWVGVCPLIDEEDIEKIVEHIGKFIEKHSKN